MSLWHGLRIVLLLEENSGMENQGFEYMHEDADTTPELEVNLTTEMHAAKPQPKPEPEAEVVETA